MGSLAIVGLLVVEWGEQEGGKVSGENLGGLYIHYLDYCDGFTGVLYVKTYQMVLLNMYSLPFDCLHAIPPSNYKINIRNVMYNIINIISTAVHYTCKLE